ncbi:integral membrane protein [Whalleya microplaca]|nr:integral membrane protein [Whalleya microplaca]
MSKSSSNLLKYTALRQPRNAAHCRPHALLSPRHSHSTASSPRGAIATMSDVSDLKTDLPVSMTMAAFAGISWYIGVEINISLFLLFKRRRGLYFWSCALGSWGVILQPLFIMLGDFGVWTDLKGSITMIYLTWLIMVVPQSWVLYSRLHLIMHEEKMLKWVKTVLIFNSIVFSVSTIVIGALAQATTINPHLFAINLIWDRIQLTVFFVQETLLSILYIYQTRKYLRDTSALFKPSSSSSNSFSARSATEEKVVLHHLIYVNLLVIALDIALLGIQYANLFYVQGAFKPCVYGIKLKVEFVILNRLIHSLRAHGNGSGHGSGEPYERPWSRQWRRVGGSGQTEVGGDHEGGQVGLVHLDRVGKGLMPQQSWS